jgi:hypothetical protein
LTPEQLAKLRDFRWYSEKCWKLADKSGAVVPFRLNAVQTIVDNACRRMMDELGFIWLNILKLRQGGITTYCTGLATHTVMTRACTALTLAHDDKLPPVWLSRCKSWRDQTPEALQPHIGTTQRNELSFDKMPSRYYVGSAAGGFPGMGDTIRFLHLSEVGSWDKAPVHVDPDKVLYDLKPALPTGEMQRGTVVIRESTGKMKGDWWHRAWMAGKEKGSEFRNVFLPWFLQEEYRSHRLAPEVIGLSDYEKRLVRYAKSEFGVDLDNSQLAWRRNEIRQDPYYGNEAEWGCRYPAYEEEAFLSTGQPIYTAAQVQSAKDTIREPEWKGYLLGDGSPELASLSDNANGELWVWEFPRDGYHYVIGADCQWGDKSVENDWDVAYVECLETGQICARLKGHYALNVWGWKLAALGFKYNLAVLAPERNSLASDGLMPVLLGQVAEWRYPNVWIRTDDVSLKGHRPQDYGWLTTNHTKGELIAFSLMGTDDGSFDWCDEECVHQMSTIITHDDLKIGAPAGMHDDCWMARLITAYVAHKTRPRTELYREPQKEVLRLTSLSDRLMASIRGEEEDE